MVWQIGACAQPLRSCDEGELRICGLSRAADHETLPTAETSVVLRSFAACIAGVAVSPYQSECDVWFVAAAALTGLPVYPSLTRSLLPFCLFLYRLSP